VPIPTPLPPPCGWDSDRREVSGVPCIAIRSVPLPKLDWDREERERRAREHGREEAWRALSTGLSELRKQWRRSKGTRSRGMVWVLEDLHEARMLVLLPKPYDEPYWRLVLRGADDSVIAEREVRGSVPPLVGMLPLPPPNWELEVYLGKDEFAYDGFGDYWP
jgi:hypothetical protein